MEDPPRVSPQKPLEIDWGRMGDEKISGTTDRGLAAWPRRLKVCHVAATSEGANWMFEQLRDLRDRYGFEVAAIVPQEQGSLVDKLRSANIRYHVVNMALPEARFRAFRKLFSAIVELVRVFRSERFDVVQSHIFSTTLNTRPAAWIADVPVRAHMIASPFPLQAIASRRIERLTSWMETALIPSCEKSWHLCRELGIPEKRLTPVIYYSPDERNLDPEKVAPAKIREEFGWPPDTAVICMVAYFYSRLPLNHWVPAELRGRGIKGHMDLVRAAPIVLDQFKNAKFVLVGSGWSEGGEAHLAEVRQLVSALHLEDSVVFTGYRADAARILRESNVAVQPSLYENLGGTLEGLLLECPTVATRVGGLVDSVRDGETGVLVNPGDPWDLARGITDLLRDPEKAQAMGRAGRRLMLERFTLSRTIDDLAQLYERLVSEESKRRKFYDRFVFGVRALAAAPVMSFIFFRYVFLELYLPGLSRPVRSGFLRPLLRRCYYFLHPTLRRLYYFVRYSPYRFMDMAHRVRRRLS